MGFNKHKVILSFFLKAGDTNGGGNISSPALRMLS
jgi:hypothetical protein